MIENLTNEQELKAEVYLNKWLDRSYRTKTITEKEAEDSANFLYDLADIPRTKYVVILDSPLECQYACNLMDDAKIYNKIYDNISDKIYAKIDDKIYDKINNKIYAKIDDKINNKIYDKTHAKISAKIYDKIHANIRAKIYANIRDKIDAKIYAKIDAKIYAKINNKIYDNISAKVYAKIDDKINNKIYDKIDAKIDAKIYANIRDKIDAKIYAKIPYSSPNRSNLWNSWFARQDYLFNELIKDASLEGKLLNEFLEKTAVVHQIYCFEEICFISDFPTEIHVNEEGSLHSTNKAALTYKDGFSLYYSNGIEMHEKYILTPADQITKEDFLSEENADMRRELIRKIGIKRVMELVGANVIDSMETPLGGKYELITCKMYADREDKYLKMKCPSTKLDHILGVDNKCTNALEAYMELNNGLKPEEMIWES